MRVYPPHKSVRQAIWQSENKSTFTEPSSKLYKTLLDGYYTMTDPTTPLVGAKYSTAIAGFFGSVVALTFAKELTIFRLLFAILTGYLTSVYTTDIAVHYLGIDPTLDKGVAFLIGLTAMALIPVVFSFIEQLKKKTGEIIQKFLG